MHINELSGALMDCFYRIHSTLGAGLFESVYEEVLCYELTTRGFAFQRQCAIPVWYDEVKLDVGFRADVIVENQVLVEIKSIERIAPVHRKQVTTYLKLTGLKLGLLVNFNEALIKDGVHRIANGP